MASIGCRPLKIGMFLPLWEDRTSGTVPPWTEFLAKAEAAKAVGFDSVWVPDHLIWLEPATIAGIEAFAPVLDLLDGDEDA